MHEVCTGAVARLDQPSHRQCVGDEGALRIAFARVDGGPRGAVDDGVGTYRRDRVKNGVAVGDVEAAAVGADHVVTFGGGRRHDVVAELTAGAGDEQPHHCPARAYFASVAAFCGRHHASLARYQPIVAASPSPKSEKRGRQPSSVRSFVQSMA